jgi:3-hydroxyacyl-[acyl-carrier-protein] dehydratase
MRFNLVDRLLDVEPGKRIRAAKNLTLAEEYLADHFPTFPVMPGVLMLEALVEAGAWLLRLTDDFRHSVIVLRGVRNVKYGSFMQPGHTLLVSAEMTETAADASEVMFKGKGEMDGTSTVSAQFTLARYNLRDRNPTLESVDKRIVEHLRSVHTVLKGDLDKRRGPVGS